MARPLGVQLSIHRTRRIYAHSRTTKKRKRHTHRDYLVECSPIYVYTQIVCYTHTDRDTHWNDGNNIDRPRLNKRSTSHPRIGNCCLPCGFCRFHSVKQLATRGGGERMSPRFPSRKYVQVDTTTFVVEFGSGKCRWYFRELAWSLSLFLCYVCVDVLLPCLRITHPHADRWMNARESLSLSLDLSIRFLHVLRLFERQKAGWRMASTSPHIHSSRPDPQLDTILPSYSVFLCWLSNWQSFSLHLLNDKTANDTRSNQKWLSLWQETWVFSHPI